LFKSALKHKLSFNRTIQPYPKNKNIFKYKIKLILNQYISNNES